MQFGMIGWYVPLSMYPAGFGENPKVPRAGSSKQCPFEKPMLYVIHV
jgi:hypothetical protein